MEPVVTLVMLQELGACNRGKIRFINLFGESVVITPEIITPESIREIDWGWAAEGLLPWEIYVREYLRRMDPALTEYHSACDALVVVGPRTVRSTPEYLAIRDTLNKARAELFVELIMEHGFSKELNSSLTKEIENGDGHDHQGSHRVLQHGDSESPRQGLAASVEGTEPG